MERRILSAAVEDFTGLWEVIWELGETHPELAFEALVETARRAVHSLASRGWVTLYRGQEFTGDEVAIPPEELDEALLRRDHWTEPVTGAVQVRVAATAAGEKALYGIR